MSAKPWKGRGAGVLELVEDHDGDTYRAVYTVRFKDVVYVLHAFQKKSPRGIKTAQVDVDLVEPRLKAAHLIVDRLRGLRPVDDAVLFLQQRRVSSCGGILLLWDDGPRGEALQRFDQERPY